MYKRTGFQILHVILGLIIVLNILDFFELLNPFWDYLKKIVSWFLVGLLFYRVSPSKILVGVRQKVLDVWFVVAAFSLTINDMLQYAAVAREAMILEASKYVGFFQESGVATTVINVTENAWNSLSVFGIVPEASVRLLEYAGQLTMNSPFLYVAFSYAGDQIMYSVAPFGLSGSLLTVYNSLFPLSGVIQSWGLLLGMIALVLWSLVALRSTVVSPSVLGLIDRGQAHGKRLFARFFFLFFSSVFFFLFIFSLVMEWLAIAIDAPILMFALLASVFLILIRHKHFSLREWEEWVMHVGAEYVEPFLQLFTQRRTILLGVSGLLVLHLLTEVLNYLLPFILPMRDQLYLAQLGAGHDSLWSLISFSGLNGFATVLIVFANVIAWFGLLVIPAYIWYKIYRLRTEDHSRHHPRFSPFVLGLFSASLLIMLLAPMIWFKKLSAGGLVGVDFFTRSFADASSFSPVMLVLWGVGIFVLVFFSAQFGMRRFMYLIPLASSVVFMGVYAYLFFLSSFENYLLAGLNAFAASSFGLGVIFFLFLLYTAVFYASGYLLFIYEIIRD